MRTYGTVEHKAGSFFVQCEPHVSLRLKRMFQFAKGQQGKIKIADTIDNAKDLDWFFSRYPMQGAIDKVRERAEECRRRDETVDAILSGACPPLPCDLALPLRSYQDVAKSVAYSRKALLLADDVGLGKTAVAIGLCSMEGTLPALIVTLTHLPLQWREEFTKFAPHLRVQIIKTGKPHPLGGLFAPDIILINYHKLATWAESLAPLMKTVVFDECQELRRVESQKYRAAKHISDHMEYRLGLSATPFYNYGGEMFNVMECITPGGLGTYKEFTAEWCSYSYEQGKERIKDPRAFGSFIRETGMMLRRTRKEVGRELPRCSRIFQPVDSDVAALDTVSGSCAELAKSILAQGEAYRGQKMQMSEEFSNRLRQATGIAKAPYVADFVRILIESGEKVVLYGWHREVYSIWLDRLKEFHPCLYTGTESPVQKDASKNSFCKGDSKVILISLRAGAGLDGLQFASSTVVFGELDWSPGVHEQCVGRIDRDGQETPVMAYFMVSESGADPVMAQVLGIKKQQIEGVRDDHELIEELQNDGGHIRKLAEAYLESKGEAVPV